MRPKEVTDFLRCGGMNCDNSCERYPNQIGDCMTARVHDYVIDLEQRVPRWISVEERLPENDDVVLVWSVFGAGVGYYNNAGYWVDYVNDTDDEVTHWMPLPELPEEDSE